MFRLSLIKMHHKVEKPKSFINIHIYTVNILDLPFVSLLSVNLLPGRPVGVVAVAVLRRARHGSPDGAAPAAPHRHLPGSFALQQRGVGVLRVEVQQQLVLRGRRVAALLAHVQLVAPLLVGVLERDAVDLLHVRLQGAALGERLVAERALVRAHA